MSRKEYHITKEIYNDNDEYNLYFHEHYNYMQLKPDLERLFRSSLKNKSMKKGDLIIVDSVAGYRNTGVLVFDGRHIRSLDYSKNKDGAIPKDFKMLEPQTGRFVNVYGYTYIVADEIISPGFYHTDYGREVNFVTTPYLDELIENIQLKTMESRRPDDCITREPQEVYFTSCLINNKPLFIAWNPADEDYTKERFEELLKKSENFEYWIDDMICDLNFSEFVEDGEIVSSEDPENPPSNYYVLYIN